MALVAVAAAAAASLQLASLPSVAADTASCLKLACHMYLFKLQPF